MGKRIKKKRQSHWDRATLFVLLFLFFLMGCGEVSNEGGDTVPVSLPEEALPRFENPANNRSSSQPTTSFTMIISSDPNLNSWGENCSADSGVYRNASLCEYSMSLKANADQYFAMASLANSSAISPWQWPNSSNLRTPSRNARVQRPYGLIINGNLTSSWKNTSEKYYEVGSYKTFYDPTYNATAPTDQMATRVFPSLANGQLSVLYKFYPGLGRTDYFSNKSGCSVSLPPPRQRIQINCATLALQYMKNKVLGVRNRDQGAIGPIAFQGYDFPVLGIGGQSSLSYYFDKGNYRFIQLHLNPKYSNSALVVSSTFLDRLIKTPLGSSFQWLQRVLSQTTNKKFVINMNDYGGTMAFNDPEFVAAISREKSKIVAIFAGNVPSNQGKYEMCKMNGRVQVCTPHIAGIPVFRSGSAEFGTFLLAEFGTDYMNVGTVRSKAWTKPANVRTNNGTEVDKRNGMNARYVPPLNSALLVGFGGKTYVTWSGQALGTNNTNGPTTRINYSAFSIDTSVPARYADLAQGINGNVFASLLDTGIKGTLPLSSSTQAAPTIEMLDDRFYLFWKDSNSSDIKYSMATQGSGGSLSWSAPIILTIPQNPSLPQMTISDNGLSSIVDGNTIFLSFLSESSRVAYTRVSITRRPTGNPFVIASHPTLMPTDSPYVPYGRPRFSKSQQGISILYSAVSGQNNKHYRKSITGQRLNFNFPPLRATSKKVIGMDEVYMTNERVQIARIAKNSDIKYVTGSSAHYSLPTIYAPDPRNSGYITRKTILGNSDVALAKSNDPNKLIAFWIDARNNDLYASIYLGRPDFMRNPANSTKDQNLLKTYP